MASAAVSPGQKEVALTVKGEAVAEALEGGLGVFEPMTAETLSRPSSCWISGWPTSRIKSRCNAANFDKS